MDFTLAGALKAVSEGSICCPIIDPKPYLITHGNGCGQARHEALSYSTFIECEAHFRLFHSKTKAGQRITCFVSGTQSELIKQESNKNSLILKGDGLWYFRKLFDSKNIS